MVNVALALLILVYLPWQVYELYRHSQLQATVIDAIEEGDPDIRQILNLVHVDPASDWTSETIRDTPQPTKVDYSGLEMLTYSRIIDLRHWQPHEPLKRRGHVYVRDRFTLQLLDSYSGDRRVTLALPIPGDDIEFRQTLSQVPAIITRVTRPHEDFGQKRTLYEFEYDLSRIPLGEPVTLEFDC